MGTFNSVEEAREFFKDDIFCAEMGITIDEVGEKYSICSLEIKKNHRNAAGGIMGGAIFSLADFAFSVNHTLAKLLRTLLTRASKPKAQ